jgi:hypothetical protein
MSPMPGAAAAPRVRPRRRLDEAVSDVWQTALVRLLGKWAWWLPKPFHWVLQNVCFGHV